MPNGSSGEGVGVQEKQLQSVSGKNDIVSICAGILDLSCAMEGSMVGS